MRAAAPATSRMSVARVIARREAWSALRGLGGHLALSAGLVAAAWIIMVDVRALDAAGLLVRADPFATPLATAMLIVSLYLGVAAATSVARDRESGTLEVLFYGPVDEISYLAGKAAGLLVAYAAALPVLLVAFAILSWITGFVLGPSIAAALVLSLVPAAAIVGFSILLSVGCERVRSAVLLFVAATLLLTGITLAYRMILLAPIDNPSSALLPLRDGLSALDAAIGWISPFAYLERTAGAISAGSWRIVLANLAAGSVYGAAMIGASALWLRARGVHGRGE